MIHRVTRGISPTGRNHRILSTSATALPNTNYIVTGNGNCAAIPKRHVGIRVGTKNTAYFTFEVTSSDNDSFLNAGEFQLVVFGLGS